MQRLAIKLVLFLLLGAIVNDAVAWGCAAWSELQEHRPVGIVVDPEWRESWSQLICRRSSGNGIEIIGVTRQRTNSGNVQLPQWVNMPVELSPIDLRTWVTVAAGWPQRSFRGTFDDVILWEFIAFAGHNPAMSRARNQLSTSTWPNGIRAPAWLHVGRPRVLPMQPIWPGFAVNTIFYAGVLWLLFFAPGFVRRRIRRFRRRCLHCGYDLRGQPPPEDGDSIRCPECGRNA